MSNQLLTPEERQILAQPDPEMEPTPEPAAPATAEAAPATAQESFVPQAPEYDTGQIQQALDSAIQQQAELQSRFDDGELSVDEFVVQQSAIAEQKAQAMAAAAIAENNHRTNEEFQEQIWQKDQQRFFKENPQFEKSPALFGALNQMVQSIAGDPSNQDRSGAWILNQAKKEVEGQLKASGASVPPAAGAKPHGGGHPAAPDFSAFDREVENGSFRDIESRLGSMSQAEADAFLRGES